MKKLFSILFALCILLVSCSSQEPQQCAPIYALDTTISITFYGVDNYNTHYRNIKNIYNEVNSICDDFNESSLITTLNTNRSITTDNEYFKELLNYSIEYYQSTNGYFNPYIGRLSHIWKNALKNKTIPSESLINAELLIMNSTSLSIFGNDISLIGDGNLDLGGIAKGYATYKAEEYLKQNNINKYLINAGSSNISCGVKFNNEAFKIALSKPTNDGYFSVLTCSNINISTSSWQHQNVIIDNVRYHHLINPKTGYPANNYDSCVVIGSKNSMELDVYSTYLFLQPLDAVSNMNKEIDVILYKDGEILYQSEGVSNYAQA